MAEIKETVSELSTVFIILFVTIVLIVNFGIIQFHYPLMIMYALMPFIVELVVRKGNVRNLGFQKTNFQLSLPLTLGLIIVWLLIFLFVPPLAGKPPLPTWHLVFIALNFYHPGLTEELCFRGFLQTRLERIFSVKKALVIQGLIFALFHLPSVFSGDPRRFVLIGPFYHILIAFIFGILMGIIYIKTRNLFVVTAFHGSEIEFLVLLSIVGVPLF